MQARDIMTTSVISVLPDTELREVLEILLERRINGVPVTEDGRVLGFVGVGDLVHRHEIGTDVQDARSDWWSRLLGSDTSPLDYVRSHGLRARDVMLTDVVDVKEDTPVATIARIFEERRIRRVVVVNHSGIMAGMVTRVDLLRALVNASRSAPRPSGPISDAAIRAQLLAELGKHLWWTRKPAEVSVHQGTVRFTGRVLTEGDRLAACVAAENIPGVRSVQDDRGMKLELPVLAP